MTVAAVRSTREDSKTSRRLMNAVAKYRADSPDGLVAVSGGLFPGDPLWADEVALRHPTVPIILTKMGRSIAGI
jgi:hypothetical protein